MLERSRHGSARTGLILPIGMAIAIVYWLGEGLLHFLVFETGDFRDVLLPSNIHDSCTRLFIVFLMIGSSVYGQLLVNKLYEATERYKALFDNGPDAIFIADADSGVITDANPAASKLLLRSHDEIVGLHQSKLHPAVKRDDSTRTFVTQVEDSKEGREARPVDQVVLRSDGVEVPVEIMAKTVTLGNRSVLQGIYRDVSERRKVEEALLIRNAAIESSITATGIIDMAGEVTYVNEACVKMWGYEDKDEIIGRHISEFWEGPGVFQTLKNLEEKGIDTGEDVGKRKDGSLFDVMFAGNVVRDTDDKIIAMLGSFLDITDRKRMEEALRLSEEKYRTFFEYDLTGDFISSADGHLVDCNKAFLDLFGFSSLLEAKSVSLNSVYPTPAAREVMLDKIRREKRIFHYEHEARKITGETIFIDQNTVGEFDEEGNLVLMRGHIIDITERKKVEEKLKQSEERFRLAMEVTNDAMWDWDMQTNEVYRNPRHATMLGYEPSELSESQDAFRDWVHPDDKDHIFGLMSEYLKGKEDPFEVEYRMLTKSGDCIWVLGRGKIVAYGEDGSPLRMVGTNIDITHRKRMEEALRRSEERYRSVVEDSPVLVCSLLPDGEITFVNAAYCKYFGKTSEELVGKRFMSLIPDEDRQTVHQNILSLNIDSPLMSQEHKVVASDGQIRWQRWTNRGIFDDKGRAICFQSFGEDITEARAAREALRESEERYRTLVESAGAAITAVNEDGTFSFMNKVGAERLGGKPEDFIGKTMWDVFPKDIADRQMDSVSEVLHTGAGTTVVSLTTVQGESRWYNTILEPLREGSSEKISVMVIARDIHEQKQAEEKLEMYRSEMSRTEQLASLGTLSATAAHEITQPLTVIQLALQNAIDELKATSCPDSVTRNVENSLDEALTISSIVDKFRSFARRSSHPTVDEVDLGAVAERIMDLLRRMSGRKRTTLRVEGMDRLPHVRSDEKDLEQLFFALIDNATRAGDDNTEPEVVVSGVVKDDHIELRFSDNCGGIAPENLDRIFEPFFTTKPPGQGTGLGLCIAQDIVTRIGGKIRVESTFGEGSTFIVTLPIHASS